MYAASSSVDMVRTPWKMVIGPGTRTQGSWAVPLDPVRFEFEFVAVSTTKRLSQEIKTHSDNRGERRAFIGKYALLTT